MSSSPVPSPTTKPRRSIPADGNHRSRISVSFRSRSNCGNHGKGHNASSVAHRYTCGDSQFAISSLSRNSGDERSHATSTTTGQSSASAAPTTLAQTSHNEKSQTTPYSSVVASSRRAALTKSDAGNIQQVKQVAGARRIVPSISPTCDVRSFGDEPQKHKIIRTMTSSVAR